MHVVFIHLDWGIGGAEQLMLQLATASRANGDTVELRTTHCSPTHCFDSLKSPDGALHPYLRVSGSWIPTHLVGRAQALCSTLRLLYLALETTQQYAGASAPNIDLIVLDVLPTPLWILRYFSNASLLFYCHFPDRLLIRPSNSRSKDRLFQSYRRFMDTLEEWSMSLADTVAVNSKFTQSTVIETFPSLREQTELPVLYPALEVRKNDKVRPNHTKISNRIVSLNRYERKKNLGLVIEAVAWVQEQLSSSSANKRIDIELVIAGGYDPRNVENVEYRGELAALAQQCKVNVDFQHSISDAARQTLLETAAAVVYTPTNEHFGIVPLEAMYAGTCVICSNSGGPVETVMHDVTGFLCETTPDSFGQAIRLIVENPDRAVALGQAGHQHVLDKFGPIRLQREWKRLVTDTVSRGRERRQRYYMINPRTLLYLLEAGIVLLFLLWSTWILRWLGVLHPQQSILSGMRNILYRDEL